MARKKFNDYDTGVPEHVIELLARCFLPAIQGFLRARRGNGNLQSGKWNSGKELDKQKTKAHKQGRRYYFTAALFLSLSNLSASISKIGCSWCSLIAQVESDTIPPQAHTKPPASFVEPASAFQPEHACSPAESPESTPPDHP